MSIRIGFQVIPLAAPCANGAIIISDGSLLSSFSCTLLPGQEKQGRLAPRALCTVKPKTKTLTYEVGQIIPTWAKGQGRPVM